MLELAILGLLADAPMHGYALRKRLAGLLGGLRAFSYGSLYPTLRRMQAVGWIGEAGPDAAPPAPALRGRRARIVYELTAAGKEHLAELLADAGPTAWEDDRFDVHLALFARTDADVRLRILQGRRRRVVQRRDGMRTSLTRTRDRLDRYTRELAEHGLESADREVRWLDELIAGERRTPTPRAIPSPEESP
ncbi:MAG: PadR family transcriptional regulator [Mycobacteriales bacterium]